MVPSRELAKQIHENIDYFSQHLQRSGMPAIKSCLAIGGMPSGAAMDVVRSGVHVMVATPGRLIDMLNKKMVTLDVCRCGRARLTFFIIENSIKCTTLHSSYGA